MPNNNFQQTPWLQSGLPQSENRPQGTQNMDGQLGIRFTFVDPTDSIAKRYQLVKADSTMDVVPYAGAVAYWRDTTGYRVTTDVSVAGRGNVAGVFLNALTVDQIGCIQIKGRADVDYDTGAPLLAGLFAVPSAADGKATAIAAGSPATYPPLGTTAATAATSGTLYKTELNLSGRE